MKALTADPEICISLSVVIVFVFTLPVLLCTLFSPFLPPSQCLLVYPAVVFSPPPVLSGLLISLAAAML